MKLLFALMLTCVASGAFADETAKVSERLSCADISARMSELGGIAEPTEDETAELAKLKADYRRTCVKSARGRRTSADTRVIIEVAPGAEVATETAEVSTPEEGAQSVAETTIAQEEVVSPQEAVVEVDPMIALEQELANLDAGLCADGSAPNKFGCCGDEVFKDLGNAVFACCPKGGDGDCFPPLK